MPQTSRTAVARAQVADAIAKVQEAMSLAEEQEIQHALHAEEPCEQNHTVEDAAFRHALLVSEDAMISVLEALPAGCNTGVVVH